MTSPITILIPCYNEEDRILQLLNSMHTLSRNCRHRNISLSILLVNNGCLDQTFTLVDQFTLQHDHCCDFQVLKVSTNQGYGFGVKTALLHKQQGNVCVIPADGKYSLDDILDLLGIYTNAGNISLMVKGTRSMRNDPIIIRILSLFYSRLVSFMLGTPSLDINGLPKIFFNSFSTVEISQMSDNACFDASLLSVWARKGCSVYEIPVTFTQHLDSTASWSGRKWVTSVRMLREVAQTRKRIRKYL